MQEFLPELALLQSEPSVAVRRALVELLGAAVPLVPTAAALAPALNALHGLLDDAFPGVAKRAALAAIGAFRAALARVAADGRAPLGPQQRGAAVALWEAAHSLKARLALLGTQAGPDGVRLAAIKFLETAVLLLSADLPPPAPGAPAPRPIGSSHAVLRPAAVRLRVFSAACYEACAAGPDQSGGRAADGNRGPRAPAAAGGRAETAGCAGVAGRGGNCGGEGGRVSGSSAPAARWPRAAHSARAGRQQRPGGAHADASSLSHIVCNNLLIVQYEHKWRRAIWHDQGQ